MASAITEKAPEHAMHSGENSQGMDAGTKSHRLNPLYSFVRALELEGRDQADEASGAALISVMRARALFGAIEERHFAYAPHIWPQTFPPGIDALAAKHRIRFYARAWNEEDIQFALADGSIVSVVLRITDQWYRAHNGVIEFPRGNFCAEDHSVGFTGFNNEDGYFIFANSWGADWGDQGYGYLPFGYFNEHGMDAYALVPSGILWKVQELIQSGAPLTIETRWRVRTPMDSLLHAITLDHALTGEHIAWAFAYVDSEYVDVEELFVAPLHRRQGHCRSLIYSLKQLSQIEARPLRFLVPAVDRAILGPDLLDLAYSLGLRVHESSDPATPRVMVERK